MQGRLAPLWGTRTLLPCSVSNLQSEGKSTRITPILGAAARREEASREAVAGLPVAQQRSQPQPPWQSPEAPRRAAGVEAGAGRLRGERVGSGQRQGVGPEALPDLRDPVPAWGTFFILILEINTPGFPPLHFSLTNI